MEENRKLVFSEEVIRKEEKRQRKFKPAVIVIAIVVGIIIAVCENKFYKIMENKSYEYIYTAQNIWNNGIEGIDYSELNVKILEDGINYEDIYKKGICDIGCNKLSISIKLDENYQILQRGNQMIIRNNIIGTEIRLKFQAESVNIKSTGANGFFLLGLLLAVVFIALVSIAIYEVGEEKRMTKDMNKLSNSDESIF